MRGLEKASLMNGDEVVCDGTNHVDCLSLSLQYHLPVMLL